MATTATATPISMTAIPSAKQQFLDAYEREFATTMRVLRAYPADKLDLKPAAKCKSARDLAFVFPIDEGFCTTVITTGLDFSQPMGPGPATPETLDEILGAYEQAHAKTMATIRDMSDEQLHETTKFFVAPKTLGDVRRIDFLQMLLADMIHHRGQFSIYLRMADGKVPSIYGPTADEPWM
jgi:uncharacterized damage-inducible protein DinB